MVYSSITEELLKQFNQLPLEFQKKANSNIAKIEQEVSNLSLRDQFELIEKIINLIKEEKCKDSEADLKPPVFRKVGGLQYINLITGQEWFNWPVS
ncbi:MAG: hypothetical protein GXY86_15895 [Firmicutes bacterium]|nr:hypothetical protein [Bacillota bacterium]